MTHPNAPQGSSQSAGPRFVGGAIDLGDVKARAQAREEAAERVNQAQQAAGTAGEVERFAEVTPESFEQDLVIRSTQVAVVLLLGTARSEASEELKTMLGRLAQMVDVPQEDVKFVVRYVDVDTNGEIAQALNVKAVPTVIALAGGRPLTQFEGGQPEEQIKRWIEAVISATDGKLQGLPPAFGEPVETEDPRMEEAAGKLESGDFDGAIAAYDAILADEPGHAEAKAARANTLLLQRVQAADNAVASGEKEADPVEAAGQEADRLLLAGQKEQAFDVLIEQIRVNADDARDAAKQRLLDLFAMFDAGDPEVIAARTRMASALF